MYRNLMPFNSSTDPLPRLCDLDSSHNGDFKQEGTGYLYQYIADDHPRNKDRRGDRTDLKEYFYKVNSRYFRADEFDSNDKALMSLGCSHTFCVGVRNEDAWPSILAKKLNLKNWNLGAPGTGNDSYPILLKQFINEGYVPEAVAVLWTSASRRTYRRNLGMNSYKPDEFNYTAFRLKEGLDINPNYHIAGVNRGQDWKKFNDTPEVALLEKARMMMPEHTWLNESWHARDQLITLCEQHKINVVERFCYVEGIDLQNYVRTLTNDNVPNVSEPWGFYGSDQGRDKSHAGEAHCHKTAQEFYEVFQSHYKYN